MCTGVQPTEETEDLRKVKLDSASRNLERTPVMVGGKLERFRDIGNMITTWDVLEQDDKEGMVEEGVRRGGRKLSRRMSELIGIFGEEKDRVVGQTGDVELLSREDTNLPSVSVSSRSASLCSKSNFSTISSKKKENIQYVQASNYNHVRSKSLFSKEKTLSAGCDWPVGLSSTNLPTNRKRVCRKRKFVSDGDGGGNVGGGITKKVREDGPAILYL